MRRASIACVAVAGLLMGACGADDAEKKIDEGVEAYDRACKKARAKARSLPEGTAARDRAEEQAKKLCGTE